jgi:hypothetical protein
MCWANDYEVILAHLGSLVHFLCSRLGLRLIWARKGVVLGWWRNRCRMGVGNIGLGRGLEGVEYPLIVELEK